MHDQVEDEGEVVFIAEKMGNQQRGMASSRKDSEKNLDISTHK